MRRSSADRNFARVLVAEYTARRRKSNVLMDFAKGTFPGGVTRAVTHYAPFPTVIARGYGAHLVDVDGNDYIDLVNNYTSLIHGNAFEPIREAVTRTLGGGTVFPSATQEQIKLAELLITRISSIELIRFTNSGSEAALLAAHIARQTTGRREIVLAEGGYQGGFAPFLPGDPEVVRTAYNDAHSLLTTITERTAAVFMEPFLGAGGVIPGRPDFLLAVQNRAREVGALFVLDEVQSLRNSYHGMQDILGLEPDLTMLGKLIGGGLALGAIGGRAELMEITSPFTPGVSEANGTFNGHNSAVAAGYAALKHLNAAAVDELNTNAAGLDTQIRASAESAGVPIAITRVGSILSIHPGSDPVLNPHAGQRLASFRSALHLALLIEGIYATPRGMINLSTVLTEGDLKSVVSGYARAFQRIAPHVDALLRAA